MSHFHGEINERVRRLERRVENAERVNSRLALALYLYLAAAAESFGGTSRKEAERALVALKGEM